MRHFSVPTPDAYEQALAKQVKPVDLEEAFTRAAADERETGDSGESSDGPHPLAESNVERLQPVSRREPDNERGR